MIHILSIFDLSGQTIATYEFISLQEARDAVPELLEYCPEYTYSIETEYE
jgi:hypothetical protein